MSVRSILTLLSGPLTAMVLYVLAPESDLSASALAVLCIALWMAIWWVTEVVPLAVTALLPLFLFPLVGAPSMKEVTTPYSHPFVFLYLGGFFIAIAIEKWNLHKRIALTIIRMIGTNIIFIILGFMIGTAFLSMWISNTASAVMLLPVGMAIVKQLQDNPDTIEDENAVFGKALMLSIAYAASIGGIATLIGTPPNLILAGVVQDTYGIELGFARWLMMGLPISIILLIVVWFYLTQIAFKFKQKSFPGGRAEILRQVKLLGPMGKSELRVLIVFACTALAWIFKDFLIKPHLPAIDDTVIALVGGCTLFLLPSERRNERLVEWKDMVKIPWDIILLFGGGLALALGFEQSGLATWIGIQLKSLDALPLVLLLLAIVAAVNFLTEFTSNLATTAMLLPVLVSVAASAGVSPFILLVGATMAASCAFMLPVATPPNAIVFGSGFLRIKEMVKIGFYLNLLSIILITIWVYFMAPIIFN